MNNNSTARMMSLLMGFTMSFFHTLIGMSMAGKLTLPGFATG